MKKVFCFVALAVFFAACTVDDGLGAAKGNPDDVVLRPERPVEGASEGISQNIFGLIDLEYPGLEKVRRYVGEEDFYSAAYELLQYFRNRTNVVNPFIDLITTSYGNGDLNMAMQASKEATSGKKYRLYVRNYSEKADGGAVDGQPLYYSFASGDGIDWKTLPKAVNGAQEFRSQKHRLQWMEPQAKVYYATKEEKYAESWVDIYGQWMAAHTNHKTLNEDGTYTYVKWPVEWFQNPTNEHYDDTVPWAGLQTAERLRALINCIWYYVNSETVTPAFFSQVLMSVYDHVQNIIANPWSHSEDSNIALSLDQSYFYAAVLFPEFADAGTWLNASAQNLTRHLIGQFNPDGVQNELDMGYHMGVVMDFMNIYDLANENNLLSSLPADFLTYVKNAAMFVQDVMYPNYWFENFNDTRDGEKKASSIQRNLKVFNSLFPDGTFEYMANGRKSGVMPSTDLKCYAESGYYMFRTGWDVKDMMLILKNNNSQYSKGGVLPWHSQPDNGHFGLYRNGRRFTPDACTPSYGGTSQTNSYRFAHRATRAHNTINVGGKNIADDHTHGRMLASGKDGKVEYLVTENPSYDNLTHRRSVFFVDKKFFVLLDEAYNPDGINSEVQGVEFNIHLNKSSDCAIDGYDGNASLIGGHTTYSDNNNMMYKTWSETEVVAEGNTSYYCNNIIDSDYDNMKIQRRFYRMTGTKPAGKAMRFITVIHPFESDYAKLNIDAEFTDNKDGEPGTFNPNSATVTVNVEGIPYVLSYSIGENN